MASGDGPSAWNRWDGFGEVLEGPTSEAALGRDAPLTKTLSVFVDFYLQLS